MAPALPLSLHSLSPVCWGLLGTIAGLSWEGATHSQWPASGGLGQWRRDWLQWSCCPFEAHSEGSRTGPPDGSQPLSQAQLHTPQALWDANSCAQAGPRPPGACEQQQQRSEEPVLPQQRPPQSLVAFAAPRCGAGPPAPPAALMAGPRGSCHGALGFLTLLQICCQDQIYPGHANEHLAMPGLGEWVGPRAL